MDFEGYLFSTSDRYAQMKHMKLKLSQWWKRNIHHKYLSSMNGN